jgi:hypothetical protein
MVLVILRDDFSRLYWFFAVAGVKTSICCFLGFYQFQERLNLGSLSHYNQCAVCTVPLTSAVFWHIQQPAAAPHRCCATVWPPLLPLKLAQVSWEAHPSKKKISFFLQKMCHGWPYLIFTVCCFSSCIAGHTRSYTLRLEPPISIRRGRNRTI